ncbi:Na+/H+ antiporter NhaA [Sphingomonas rubra]|uniref:Na(+)/H(+) antiporter NhaA n=1 Tax=Sphingomonas rubra TaxID=634430 RepID=A0A1I5Q1Q9_9SPHN|nr:Na+/H+ antiporter NhaA [Sphingomonas rubra]SFP40163.1 sodium/proton antiporter, NhaA family (TC 2.A.33.1.1) [Sphingomonas rubra]
MALSPLRPLSALRALLTSEAGGGVVLALATALALGVANSPFAPAYFGYLHHYAAGLSVLHWINDGLMAVFFLLVGLELKRELLDGQLRTWGRRILPAAAAAGGMIAPALIYLALNWHDPVGARGWAIPTATDIAFALGVLALLGSRAPVSLKVLLTAIAVLDDLGAIVVIALFYTDGLAVGPLAIAGAGLGLLVACNRLGVRVLWPYLLVGAGVWWAVLQSGVHATLAGVAVALTVPIDPTPGRPEAPDSPLHRLEHALAPWVAFGIVPVFAFANAGVSLAGLGPEAALAPVPLGIVAGLFVGKQLGVFGACWALIRADVVDMPACATWRQLYGMAMLCGVGFTMSLFIGVLAFGEGSALTDAVKIGVLAGSALSAISGFLLLRSAKGDPAC